MVRRIAVLATLVCAAVLLTGCAGEIAGSHLTPRLSPPVIARPGVLRAVVDLSYPPFGGTASGRRVGLDVDVAAAIAEQLGLKLEITGATPDAAVALLHEGKADVLLGGLTVESAVASDVAFAGTYISDAPAVFSTATGTVGIADLGGKKIAAQTGSVAYWALADAFGEDTIVAMPTLRDALSAAASGTVDYAAGDAIVGSYIIRDMPNMHFSGQIAPSYPLGIGVRSDKALLESDVRSILDGLAAKGVLATLRHKWVGDLPELQAPSLEASASIGATTAP
jgi:polar amino acid transport system substrate-binding protein